MCVYFPVYFALKIENLPKKWKSASVFPLLDKQKYKKMCCIPYETPNSSSNNMHVWEGLPIILGLWIHCSGVNREVALLKKGAYRQLKSCSNRAFEEFKKFESRAH